ncbi:MAG: hypothetical protein ISS79_05635 [Phycisphaerae bacterium]|nr:hypothetical protein [Phycisphaerae bacterium]
MQSINRTGVIVRPKQLFVDWLNSLPDDDTNYTLERISTDNLTFLIPEYVSPDGAVDYIRKKHSLIFEWVLWGWITAEEYWPKKRNWKMFNDWFDLEVNSEVFDLVDGDIEKEDL